METRREQKRRVETRRERRGGGVWKREEERKKGRGNKVRQMGRRNEGDTGGACKWHRIPRTRAADEVAAHVPPGRSRTSESRAGAGFRRSHRQPTQSRPRPPPAALPPRPRCRTPTPCPAATGHPTTPTPTGSRGQSARPTCLWRLAVRVSARANCVQVKDVRAGKSVYV